MTLLPRNAVLLAFEGPDAYSMVGGLGTRVTELSAALAAAGVRTTLVFVGDPNAESVERPRERLELRRWCQSISKRHPGNVYDDELSKMREYRETVPGFVIDAIVAPAAERDESVLVIAEDWQTAPTAIALDAGLRARGLRARIVLAWNANNTYGFDTIDWPALADAAKIATVSRYMKFELRARGVEARVIANGVPQRLLDGAPAALMARVHAAFTRRRPLFVKVARFDQEKRWMQAVDAFAAIAGANADAMLVARGGREPYGDAVMARARELGLRVDRLSFESRDPADAIDAIAASRGQVVDVRSFVPEDALLALYRVADAVLANSGREPFGLVGLEVMAVGGVAVTGSTGEDYVEPFDNALVCDTGDPRELVARLEDLLGDRTLETRIRGRGPTTAARYAWPRILDAMARKLMGFDDRLRDR